MYIADYLRLYFIMGSNNTVDDPLFVLEEALKGGITLFQFREKGHEAKTGYEKKELAHQMQKLCYRYSVPFIVNDDVDLALAIEADGVHVGKYDESIGTIKRHCPKDFIIGASATNAEEAVQAAKAEATYIGVGPIYATATKEDAKIPIGLDGIRHIRSLVNNVPIVAIGGIKANHVDRILNAGANGISLITAISQAKEPERATKRLRMLIDRHRK